MGGSYDVVVHFPPGGILRRLAQDLLLNESR